MRFLLVMVVAAIILSGHSCAQSAQQQKYGEADTSGVAPGTVKVIARVKSQTRDAVEVVIQQVIVTGSGITNPVSAGQQLKLSLQDQREKLSNGKLIECVLREKMAVDASQSSYILLNFKKREN